MPLPDPVSFSQQSDLLPKALKVLALLALTLFSTACGRQFSVSVNEQTLYDPRPVTSIVRVGDIGLQSCINVLARTRNIEDANDIDILACPGLGIESLDGLAALGRLRFLDVANNELVHLDELRHLSRLSSVNAPDNRLRDISALLQIPTLTSAVLTGNNAIPCDQLDALQDRLQQNLLRPEACAM